MRLSFTGTWRGMTERQQAELRALLSKLRPSSFIHGGCIGADDEADAIAADLGIPRWVFPSDRLDKSVPFSSLLSRPSPVSRHQPALPPLQRNPLIVRAGDELVAAPSGPERLRSGTWATVRCARRLDRPVTLLLP